MKNLKWWQWCLIIFIGIPMVGATIDVMTGRDTSTSKIDNGFEPAKAKFEVIGGPGMFAMTFSPKTDPETLPEIAREQCGNHKICKVIGWTDPAFAARAMPILYMFPRQQNVVLGGTHERGNDQLQSEPAEVERQLRGHSELMANLKGVPKINTSERQNSSDSQR